MEFSIQTNATLLDDEKLDFFRENDVGIGVSVDGLKNIHDRFRKNLRGKGTFKEVKEKIDLMKEKGFKINIISVGSKETLDKKEEYVNFIKKLDPKSFQINPLHSIGRGSDTEEQILNPGEYTKLIKHLMLETSKMNSNGHNVRMTNAKSIINNIRSFNQPYRCMRSPCGAGVDMISIKKGGEVYPCAEMLGFEEFKLGNIEEGVEELLSCSTAERLRKTTVKDRKKCRECSLKYFCGGGCKARSYMNSGKINTPSRLCEYYKEIFPWTMLKMYEEGWMNGYLQ